MSIFGKCRQIIKKNVKSLNRCVFEAGRQNIGVLRHIARLLSIAQCGVEHLFELKFWERVSVTTGHVGSFFDVLVLFTTCLHLSNVNMRLKFH